MERKCCAKTPRKKCTVTSPCKYYLCKSADAKRQAGKCLKERPLKTGCAKQCVGPGCAVWALQSATLKILCEKTLCKTLGMHHHAEKGYTRRKCTLQDTR